GLPPLPLRQTAPPYSAYTVLRTPDLTPVFAVPALSNTSDHEACYCTTIRGTPSVACPRNTLPADHPPQHTTDTSYNTGVLPPEFPASAPLMLYRWRLPLCGPAGRPGKYSPRGAMHRVSAGLTQPFSFPYRAVHVHILPGV